MATWYVRPDTSHSGTRNGTTYATAWGGWSAITWGVGGVTAGDTLLVCGAHAYAANVTIGAHLGTLGNECVISGSYAADPGSITFSGSVFISNARSHTKLQFLTITGATSNCVYESGAPTNVSYTDNAFIGGTGSIISLDGSSSHTSTTISRNTFVTSLYSGSSGSAINWLVGTAATGVITDMTIEDNTFVCAGTGAHRGVIVLRVQSDANVASKFTRVKVRRNDWSVFKGVACEIGSGFPTFGQSAGVLITDNTISNGSETSNALGGGFSIWGFTTDPAFPNHIARNAIRDVAGPTGGFNVFYGTYEVFDNVVDGTTTTTIDGNGMLFDFGNQGARAYRNIFRNLAGKAGTSNSGVGVMVLDSTGCKAFGNLIENCYVGVHLGSAGAGQSCVISGNTFAGVVLYGVDLKTDADEANCTVKNNIFIADTGSAVSVRNGGAAWSGEDWNAVVGFAVASGHTLGANDRTTADLLSDDYRLMSGSTLIGAGSHISYTRDADGKQRPNPPSIGAYDVATLRLKLTADPAA